MAGKPSDETARVGGADAKKPAPAPGESAPGESHFMKALRYATEKVNRENKHPDEPPLVLPGDLPER